MSDTKPGRKVLGFPDPLRRRPPAEAQKLIRAALTAGRVGFCSHAREAMEEDALTSVEVEGILRAGAVQEPESEKGDWRYQVRTQRACVVVAFRSDVEVVVVTVWRN